MHSEGIFFYIGRIFSFVTEAYVVEYGAYVTADIFVISCKMICLVMGVIQ